MNPQLTRIRAELDEASVRARKAVESVLPALVGARPASDSWSIAECLAHLTVTTDAYLAVLRPAFERAREEELRHTGEPFRLETFSHLLAWYLEPPYRMKSKAPAAFLPSVAQPGQALPDFLDRQEKLLALITEADGLALGRIRIASPFAASLKYSAYAALHLLPVHQRRHLWQAEQVAARLRGSE